MKRNARRRLQRAAAAAGLTVAQFLAWEQRELPDDHPNPGEEPIGSSRNLGLRMIKVVERSGVLPRLEARMHKRLGRKRHVAVKAVLVGMHIAAHRSRSYRRSDISAVLAGLHPAVAAALGLADHNGCPRALRYKTLARTIKTLERLLRWGWFSEGVRCDLVWFANAMVAASVPRRIRRTTTAVALDSTPWKGWAVTRTYIKQKDLDKEADPKKFREFTQIENDAYAKHRRDFIENPDLPEPESKRHRLAAAAKRLGIEVGEDGRIIRGKDRDMRVGWATATAKRKGGFFVGYDLHVVVACRTIAWQGQPDRYQLGPEVTPYVLAMVLAPAGTDPGPVGYDAVMKARKVAPGIREVVADRGYTLKRKSFLRRLHKKDVNVVMDYPQRMVKAATPITLGKRKQPAMMHCGTILPIWAPKQWLTPPAHLNREGNDEPRQKWYTERAKLYRWRTNGSPRKGHRQLKCPVHAGRVTMPSAEASSYAVPLVPVGDSGCCDGKVTARRKDLDYFQEHPYGTPVWVASYHRRSVVESVVGRLTVKEERGGERCEALGLTANTMAAVARVVAYNRKKSQAVKRIKRIAADKRRRLATALRRTAATPQTAQPPAAEQAQALANSDAETPPRAPP